MTTTMIVTFDRKLRVGEHFRAGEFACPTEDTIIIGQTLLNILEEVRIHFEQPVHITSGYRNKAHNLKVGGAPDSMHMLGIAADIKVDNTRPKEVYDYINSQYPDRMGLGLYKSWVHIDTRLFKARWEG